MFRDSEGIFLLETLKTPDVVKGKENLKEKETPWIKNLEAPHCLSIREKLTMYGEWRHWDRQIGMWCVSESKFCIRGTYGL